jgi:hypothetical protein
LRLRTHDGYANSTANGCVEGQWTKKPTRQLLNGVAIHLFISSELTVVGYLEAKGRKTCRPDKESMRKNGLAKLGGGNDKRARRKKGIRIWSCTGDWRNFEFRRSSELGNYRVLVQTGMTCPDYR